MDDGGLPRKAREIKDASLMQSRRTVGRTPPIGA